jgi:predicted transcriptional regulator
MELDDDKKATKVFSCLANEKRLKLLKAVIKEGGSLRQIHNRVGNEVGLSHRETTHTYLEQLHKAGLINKKGSENCFYSSDINMLRFEFLSS